MKLQPTSALQPLPEILATRDGRLVLLCPACEADLPVLMLERTPR